MLLERLKIAGVRFEAGMTTLELDGAEAFFGFRFPVELREFLSRAVPVGPDFFDYRDRSEENKGRFDDFQAGMENPFGSTWSKTGTTCWSCWGRSWALPRTALALMRRSCGIGGRVPG